MKRSQKSPESIRRRNRNLFFIALAVIIALLLFFCNQRLNENTEVENRDSLSAAEVSKSISDAIEPLRMEIIPLSGTGTNRCLSAIVHEKGMDAIRRMLPHERHFNRAVRHGAADILAAPGYSGAGC